MADTDNFDFSVIQTGDVMVSAYPEQLDCDDERRELWAYCLRIENNLDQCIRLLRRNFCITDSFGQNHYDLGEGFDGELPDLEPGECFEFEDTAIIDGRAAVLYGSCIARKADGTVFHIDIPLMQLSTANPLPSRFSIN